MSAQEALSALRVLSNSTYGLGPGMSDTVQLIFGRPRAVDWDVLAVQHRGTRLGQRCGLQHAM